MQDLGDEVAVYLTEPLPHQRTLVDILHATTTKHAHAAAIDDGRRVVTYRRLADETDALCRRLQAAGIGPGIGSACGSPPVPLSCI